MLDLQRLDQLVERRPPLGVLGQQRSDGVGDLPPSAVADGEVHGRARPVAGVLLRLLEDGDASPAAAPPARPSPAAATAARGGQVAGDVLDDPQQRGQLGLRPAQVVGGEQEERDDLDARLVAPAQQVDDLVRAPAVPVVDVLEADGPGPAAVAVHDHADVAGRSAPSSARASRRS